MSGLFENIINVRIRNDFGLKVKCLRKIPILSVSVSQSQAPSDGFENLKIRCFIS